MSKKPRAQAQPESPPTRERVKVNLKVVERKILRGQPDVFDLVRKTLPAARRVLRDGIDPARADFYEEIDAAQLNPPDDVVDQLIDWTDQAYILGVAVGLLLNPSLVLGDKRGR